MDDNKITYELDEHGVHPLWNRAVELSEQLDAAIRLGHVPWTEVKDVAAELVVVAEKALNEGPVKGLA